MPLSGLTATTDFELDARYRARERRAPPDRPGKADPAFVGPAADAAAAPYDAAYFASRFKTDLSQLKVFAEGEETANPPEADIDPALAEFFGQLSVLLVAVRSGDIARAQAAADVLELDALVERNGARRPGGSGPMLDDLVAVLSASHSRSESAGPLAPRDAAGVAEPVPPPDPYAEATEDGGAAYETLTHFGLGDPASI